MSQQNQIPRLEDLDSSQPDYAQQLDEGLEQVDDRMLKADDDLFKSSRQKDDEYVAKLKGIEGVVVEEHSEKPDVPRADVLKEGKVCMDSEFIFGFERRDRTIEKIRRYVRVIASTAEQLRLLEDMDRSHSREISDAFRDYQDKRVKLERLYLDFKGAMLGLTEVTPLTDIDTNNDSLHFFIPREDGVYEAHLNKDSPRDRVVYPTKNPHLNPESLEQDISKEFREQVAEIKARVYMVKNPCKNLTATSLYAQGMMVALDDYDRQREEKTRKLQKQANENPVQYLVKRVKDFIDGFKK
jgi:hypothetical protein